MAQEYKHDKKLFTKKGDPLIFFLRPCTEKTVVRPMVEHGGGKVISKFVPNAIKLATEGDYVGGTDYISTKYILECVSQNKLLDTAKFKMKKQSGTKFSSEKAQELSDISDDLSPSSSVIMEAKDRKGRNKYTTEEDIKMIEYIVTESRRNGLSGKQLYKDMALLKITDHSAESMNCRMRKMILPNIKKYSIPDTWINYLTNSSPLIGLVNTINSSKYFNKQLDFHKMDKSTTEKSKELKKDDTEEIDSYSSEDDFNKKLTPAAKSKKGLDVSSIKKMVKSNESKVGLSKSDSGVDVQGDVTKNNAEEQPKNGFQGSDTSSDDLVDAGLIHYAINEDTNGTNSEKSKPDTRRLSPQKKSSPVKQSDEGQTSSKILRLSPRKHTHVNNAPKNQKNVNGPTLRRKESHLSYVMADEEESDTSDRTMYDDEVKVCTEVDRFQSTLTRLGELYGLLEEEVYHLIKNHDGNVQETMKFIETGKSCLTWDSEDDEDFDKNINKLNKKHGESRVKLRAAFLEGV